MPEGRISLLSFVGGEEGYLALTSRAEGTSALRLEGSEETHAVTDAEIGAAAVELEAPAGPLSLAWSPAGPMLEFEVGDELVRVHGIAASASGAGGPISGPGVLWDLPATGSALARTAWAATAKGSLSVLVALSPGERAEHGTEIVGAARMLPGAEPYGYAEPLLSTEYDGSGMHTRATLELWVDGEDHPPERGAGTLLCGSSDEGPAGELNAARFRWSIGGTEAIGAYEILRP